jgi:type III secretion protein Q
MPAWFKSYPQPKPLARASEAQSAGVPLRIDFRLGTSTLPMSLLGQIAIGDALLIQRPAQIAMVGEKPLCRFHFEGAEIMLDRQFETYEENLLQENEDGDEIYDEAEPHSDDSFRLDELPVVVEFILHRETMCFSDLRELYTGSVLTAQPDAASKVKIRANGRLVATGQLVQVGEQLAVQVQTVHFASK